ncbi:hypothetical protein F2Q70_00010327 [Brassica cretica]|uniref:Uncharacterized protein ycf68 n=1 Tax=Brassica cretica TaxID=69181 RepID=A0A8S9M846_BRACR|nr:hypothetical protein F2Q70_00010327 [Brassica cretica]
MGFLSLLAWHSGPPAGGPHDGLLAQWRIDGAIQVRSNVDPTFYSLVGSGRSGGDHHGSSLLENPYIPYQCMDSYLSSAGLGGYESNNKFKRVTSNDAQPYEDLPHDRRSAKERQ